MRVYIKIFLCTAVFLLATMSDANNNSVCPTTTKECYRNFNNKIEWVGIIFNPQMLHQDQNGSYCYSLNPEQSCGEKFSSKCMRPCWYFPFKLCDICYEVDNELSEK